MGQREARQRSGLPKCPPQMWRETGTQENLQEMVHPNAHHRCGAKRARKKTCRKWSAQMPTTDAAQNGHVENLQEVVYPNAHHRCGAKRARKKTCRKWSTQMPTTDVARNGHARKLAGSGLPKCPLQMWRETGMPENLQKTGCKADTLKRATVPRWMDRPLVPAASPLSSKIAEE